MQPVASFFSGSETSAILRQKFGLVTPAFAGVQNGEWWSLVRGFPLSRE